MPRKLKALPPIAKAHSEAHANARPVEAIVAPASTAAEPSVHTVIALIMVIAGIFLMASCDVESSNLGNMYQGPSAEVYFNNDALPDGRTGAVDSFEAQYAGRTFRGRLKRSGNSWVASLSGVKMNTAGSIEFRIMAKNQMVYQAYQSGVRFADQQRAVRIDDCNVRAGWSGTLHQNSCRWAIR